MMKNKIVKRLGLPLAFASLAIAGILALTTGALFTDSEPLGANTFTAGTVDLSATPTSAVLTGSTLAPGDSLVGEITVNNAGTLGYRYNVQGVVSNNIGWTFTVKSGVTTCSVAGFAGSGTVLYGPTVLTTTTANLVGDPTTGQQTGDRTLAASASEKLCVMANLPLATGNTAQTQTVTATFTFNAEQTANN